MTARRRVETEYRDVGSQGGLRGQAPDDSGAAVNRNAGPDARASSDRIWPLRFTTRRRRRDQHDHAELLSLRHDGAVRPLIGSASFGGLNVWLARGPCAIKDPVTPPASCRRLTKMHSWTQVKMGDNCCFMAIRAHGKAISASSSPTTGNGLRHVPSRDTSDTHPARLSRSSRRRWAEFATLRDMINWCIEKAQRRPERISIRMAAAMKALEAYIYWSNRDP